MEETNPLKIHSSKKELEEEWRNLSQNLIQTLPHQISWTGTLLILCDGIWYPQHTIKGLVYLKKYFKPQKNDILLVSNPKSGTNWLKALTFTIVNRSQCSLKDSPMHSFTVHQLVPMFDQVGLRNDHFPDFDTLAQPRVFNTHASYDSLPCSIKGSGNKIVYICRNPFDQIISFWDFLGKVPTPRGESVALDEAFERFCEGNHGYGPFWDHTLGYWRASTERPDKVLFLKYEDLKKDNIVHIKKLATFLGFPFSEEEEKQGLVQEISNFCAFENMKNLEVNKTGEDPGGIRNTAFFRKGQVGDFHNYLSPEKIEKMKKLIKEKFGRFGLSFDVS